MHSIKSLAAFVLAAIIMMSAVISFPNKAYAADSSSSAGIVTTSGGSLNVRSSASANAQILTTLPKGSYITVISKSGSWWKVEYASGKYGYCSSTYITPISSEAAKVSTSGSSLNVRTGPSVSYSVKSKLANGKTVIRLSEYNDFTKILYNGKYTGYVSSRYLKKYTDSGTSSVYLSVPNYKQTDSRWASVTLGSSGKTIGSIGCTTTALAMLESYRTGTSITPSAMSKKLTYSSSGSLYWPNNYRFITSSNGYLNKILDLLRNGKPVILGCKKSNGNQHWVVVTGFNGKSVSASNFTINDPGSSSRATLSQFLSVYPNFYKIAYYA